MADGRSKRLIDMIGKRFNLLTVTSRGENRNHKPTWNCVCDCGNAANISGNALRRGKTKSCGCLIGKASKHGMARTKVYRVYSSMLGRCNSSTHHAYASYGGRGIAVCERWSGATGFESFMLDMGPRPAGMTLDRKNNDAGYSPENCQWATCKEQADNRRKPQTYSRNKRNKSGVLGVVRRPNGKYVSTIGASKKMGGYLGIFDDFFEACCARKSAESLRPHYTKTGEQ